MILYSLKNMYFELARIVNPDIDVNEGKGKSESADSD